MIHKSADVQTKNIGSGTKIWQNSVILPGAKIGENCNINCQTFIENDVIIGNNVTIKSGVYLWDGIRVNDNVFIGPGVVFTNDIYPRSKVRIPFVLTILEDGCSIGANSTILGGVRVGKYAMSGIGSVITKNVPNYGLVYGNPARIRGFVDKHGEKLRKEGNKWISENLILLETPEGVIEI